MDGGTPTRRYRDGTLVLETTFETADGAVRVIDFMPPREDDARPRAHRRGRARPRAHAMELVDALRLRPLVPWVRSVDGTRLAVAGPDALAFRTPADTRGEDLRTDRGVHGRARASAVPFVLTWYPSHDDPPAPLDPERALADTESFWREWNGRRTQLAAGEWREVVPRSLITLKALTYAPTGGIVAAPTTSLPEEIGGVRNWDYRYCWLRDATFTLLALLNAGYVDEARTWRAGCCARSPATRPSCRSCTASPASGG